MDDEYEILPKGELDYLRKEVEKLKENPYGDKEESKTLLESMEKLNDSVNKLISLFQKTQKELVEEYAKTNPSETLSEVLDQNEKIAKGTLAVADLLKKQQSAIDEIKVNLDTNEKEYVKKKAPKNTSSMQSGNQSNKNDLIQDPFRDNVNAGSSNKQVPNIPPPPAPNKNSDKK